MNYARALLDLRNKMNWSQSELAKELDITQKAVSALETGENTRPHRANAEKIIKLLVKNGISVPAKYKNSKTHADLLTKDDNGNIKYIVKIARLEGRIEELEKKVLEYRGLVEGLGLKSVKKNRRQ